jgi:lambda family phage portal protein
MKFPAWPFGKRAAPIGRRAYSGAVLNRLTSDWITMSTSGDAEIRGSLKMLRNRTRQLERDNDYIKNYLDEIENNVIGPNGISFQSRVKMIRGNALNDKVNSAIQDKFSAWAEKKNNCHVAGKLCFNDMELLLSRSVARDGEIVFRKIQQKFGTSKIPFALEVLEADRLDDDYNGRAENGNEIRMGVELDSWGRPTAYYFFTYHPGDYPFSGSNISVGQRRVRIPADEIIHPFVTHRASQTRGVSWIASAIMRLRHMQGYEEAEVIAARASAAIMGFVETAEGEAGADDVQDNDRVTDFEPGLFKYLAPGEKVNIPNMARPGGQFGPFMKMMLKGTAAGLGSSYESISKDFSETNYSSARLSLLAARDHFRKIQKWTIRNFHQPVFEAWLEMAVMSGEVSLPDYESNPEKYESVRWMPRGWAWVDPLKEVSAYRDAILGGLKSATRIVSQEGEDIEDLYQEIDYERKLASKYGLVFDTDAKNGIKITTVPPKPSAAEQVKGDETV